jgi:heat shock protein HslJ
VEKRSLHCWSLLHNVFCVLAIFTSLSLSLSSFLIGKFPAQSLPVLPPEHAWGQVWYYYLIANTKKKKMHLSTLTSVGLTSILFNALHSHGQQLLRGGGKLSIPELPSTDRLVGTNWKIKEIHGVPAVPHPQGQQELSFVTWTDTEILSGYDGCNFFDGEWDTVPSSPDNDSQTGARQRISFNLITTTHMECEFTPEADEQKRTFMGALRQKAIDFSLSADEQELTLYGPQGSNHLLVPIVLTRIPSPQIPQERLIGTSWVATDIPSWFQYSKGELRQVLEDHPVTLTFSPNEIKGSTGTNQFFGDLVSTTWEDFQVRRTNVGQTFMGWEDDTDPRRSQERTWMDIIGSEMDHIKTIPYYLFEQSMGGTDEWTAVLLLGSYEAPPLARFVPLKDDKQLDGNRLG